MTIGIVGAGAFGTALAIALAPTRSVVLWARSPDQAQDMLVYGENRGRLAGCKLPDNLKITSNFRDLEDAKTLLLAVPLQTLRQFLTDPATRPAADQLVACCKGIEMGTGASAPQIMAECIPNSTAALLTGPSFAKDIARGLPTALTLACSNETVGKSLQQELSTPVLRLYRSSDVTGAALGGALKNVIAIACGAAIGAGLGDSARAALMTRGNAEMQRYAQLKGAHAATLSGLSGFGDLVLTCTSEQSRNYQLGLSIGRGVGFDPKITVEGAATARAVAEEARLHNLDMPIASVVAGLVENRLDVDQAMAQLLSRSLKEE